EGYTARIWLAEGSKDTAVKVHFHAADRPDAALRGKLIAIAKDAKAITLETPPKERTDPPRSVEVKLTAKTRLIFNGVGSDGAALTEGMIAVAILADGST